MDDLGGFESTAHLMLGDLVHEFVSNIFKWTNDK